MKKERIFWGLFFLLAAVLVLLSRFPLFAEVSLWRIVITIALALWLLQSIMHRSMSGVLFSIALLLICYDDVLPLSPLTPGTLLLAAALGSIGFYFLLPKHPAYHEEDSHQHWENADTQSFGDAHVQLKTSMGAGIKYVSSNDFQQADIECSMGAMKVYFDNAHILGESAVIHLSAMMSSVELYVPKEWCISQSCVTTLGGVSESGRMDPNPAKQVSLSGKVTLSGVKIIYI